MKHYILPVHSFVDVITNSSSEIYISADKNTIKALEKMIDNLLALAGSTKTSKDLFTIDITQEVYVTKNGKFDSVYLTKEEIKKGLEAEEFDEDDVVSGNSEYGYEQNHLRITPLVESEEAKAVAKTLEKITSLFSIESCYNG